MNDALALIVFAIGGEAGARDETFVKRLLDECPEAKLVQSLAQGVIAMIRERKVGALKDG